MLNKPIFIFVLAILMATGSNAQSHLPSQHVIIIGLDGLSTEGFQKARHPHIDALFADGILSLNTRTVMPSVTLPNWTSHLTGAGPEQHGVFGNDWEKEVHALDPQEQDSDGYYPSIFKLIKEEISGAKTAFYYNWSNLIKPHNQRYFDEITFEEDDAYDQNYRAAANFIGENQSASTLTFLYSVHVDHAGHAHEWMSPEYISAIEEVDKAIGNLVAQLKGEGLYEDTYFLLITDHGGVASGHGGTSKAEMEVPWMIKGPDVRKDQEYSHPNSNTNTAAVIAHIFGIRTLPESWTGKVPKGIFTDQ